MHVGDLVFVVVLVQFICEVAFKPFSVKFFETLGEIAARKVTESKATKKSNIIILPPFGRD